MSGERGCPCPRVPTVCRTRSSGSTASATITSVAVLPASTPTSSLSRPRGHGAPGTQPANAAGLAATEKRGLELERAAERARVRRAARREQREQREQRKQLKQREQLLGGVPRRLSPNAKSYASVTASLQELVGLNPAKAWCRRALDEGLRCRTAGVPVPLRHVLLPGRLGTGRKTAARLMAQALHASGAMPTATLKEGLDALQPGFCCLLYHGDLVDASGGKLGDLLEEQEATARAAKSPFVVIFALQKREPTKVTLKPFTSRKLAAVALQKLASRLKLGSGTEHRWSSGERAHDMADEAVAAAGTTTASCPCR